VRVFWLAVAVVASGCGVLSGLDQLEVGDSSIDVQASDGDAETMMDARDATKPSDAGPPPADGPPEPDSTMTGPCDFVESGATDLKCPVACVGSCCAGSSGLECNSTCINGVTLDCETSDQCEAGSVCCIDNIVSVTQTCPGVLTANMGAHAVCQTACLVDKLCVSDLACGSGHCRLVVLAADPDAALGICADF
jgi:hypothetical protein